MVKEKVKFNSNNLNWILIFTLFWVILIIILAFLFFFIELSFGIIMLIFGVIMVFFNKWLYIYMARFSSWGYEKIGAREMGKAIESDLYRIFYRIIIFFVGLMVIYIGTSSILQYFGINWEFLF